VVAFNAIILCSGFISAESAVIGRFNGCDGDATSTITTEFAVPVSRTQMNFSDSIVTLVKEIIAGLMPSDVSCVCVFYAQRKRIKEKRSVSDASEDATIAFGRSEILPPPGEKNHSRKKRIK